LDYACSAPYVEMRLDDSRSGRNPDAIMFSPHKFLGGPGTGGILIMKKSLYRNSIPDHPGGGTVIWTDPWEGREYFDDIEMREDGGTPGFLQLIKTAMAVELKEQMNPSKIRKREKYLLQKLFDGMEQIPGLYVMEGKRRERLGVVSFVMEGLPYNLVVRLLNDLEGIQSRGGCSCAGTYGHYLFNLDRRKSEKLKQKILSGHSGEKPGWVRISIHPTTTEAEVETVLETLDYISRKGKELARKDYVRKGNAYFHRNFQENPVKEILDKAFQL
jgi:selenocysteine lyase/cysteine desulfurase